MTTAAAGIFDEALADARRAVDVALDALNELHGPELDSDLLVMPLLLAQKYVEQAQKARERLRPLAIGEGYFVPAGAGMAGRGWARVAENPEPGVYVLEWPDGTRDTLRDDAYRPTLRRHDG